MGRERGCTPVWPLCLSFSPRKLCVGKIRCQRQAGCCNSLCGARARSSRSTNTPSYALTNQLESSITVEAIARCDVVDVRRQVMLASGARTNQREPRCTLSVEVTEPSDA